MTAQRRRHYHVINKPTRDNHADAECDCRTDTDVAYVRIDKRAAAEIVDQDQEGEAAEPRDSGFPAKPVQRARNEIGNLASLDDIKAAAMDIPHLCLVAGVQGCLFFFSESRVKPCEVISRAYPHDAGKHVCPAK